MAEIWVAGLPWSSWLLLLASFGIGLGLVLVFYFKQRQSRFRQGRQPEGVD